MAREANLMACAFQAANSIGMKRHSMWQKINYFLFFGILDVSHFLVVRKSFLAEVGDDLKSSIGLCFRGCDGDFSRPFFRQDLA